MHACQCDIQIYMHVHAIFDNACMFIVQMICNHARSFDIQLCMHVYAICNHNACVFMWQYSTWTHLVGWLSKPALDEGGMDEGVLRRTRVAEGDRHDQHLRQVFTSDTRVYVNFETPVLYQLSELVAYLLTPYFRFILNISWLHACNSNITRKIEKKMLNNAKWR